MKKRGGSLENSNVVLYIVAAIAFFNLVAFLSAHDWNSIVFFALAGFVAYALKLGLVLSLVIAIISANVFRASKALQEGLENKKHKPKKHSSPKKDDKKPDPLPKESKSTAENAAPTVLNSNTLEGLTSTANGLMERQDKLHELAGQLGPLMNQASSMLKQLPEGFLQNAFKNKK
jgi:hypothetical protein